MLDQLNQKTTGKFSTQWAHFLYGIFFYVSPNTNLHFLKKKTLGENAMLLFHNAKIIFQKGTVRKGNLLPSLICDILLLRNTFCFLNNFFYTRIPIVTTNHKNSFNSKTVTNRTTLYRTFLLQMISSITHCRLIHDLRDTLYIGARKFDRA